MARKPTLKPSEPTAGTAISFGSVSYTPTKGDLRKLSMLVKSVGVGPGRLAWDAYIKDKATAEAVEKADPVAVKIEEALAPFANDKSFRLGNKGYAVRRTKGKGAKGFLASRIT